MQKTIIIVIIIAVTFIAGLWYGASRNNRELVELRNSIESTENTNRELEITIQRINYTSEKLTEQLNIYRDRVKQQQVIIDAIRTGLITSGGTIADIDSGNSEAQAIVKRLLQALLSP